MRISAKTQSHFQARFLAKLLIPILDNQNDCLILLNVNLKNYSLFNSANFLDSSSVLKGVIKSFKYLYKALKKDGLYIIEDLQTSYFPRYGGSRINLRKKNTSLNFFKDLTDSINYEKNDKPFFHKSVFDGNVKFIHFYQNVVVVKKGESRKLFYKNSQKKISLINFAKKAISYLFK